MSSCRGRKCCLDLWGFDRELSYTLNHRSVTVALWGSISWLWLHECCHMLFPLQRDVCQKLWRHAVFHLKQACSQDSKENGIWGEIGRILRSNHRKQFVEIFFTGFSRRNFMLVVLFFSFSLKWSGYKWSCQLKRPSVCFKFTALKLHLTSSDFMYQTSFARKNLRDLDSKGLPFECASWEKEML